MRIEILDEAQEDLIEGFRFYEKREIGKENGERKCTGSLFRTQARFGPGGSSRPPLAAGKISLATKAQS